MDEYSPRTGKSKIQVAGTTKLAGPKIVTGGGQCVDIGVGAHHVCAVSQILSSTRGVTTTLVDSGSRVKNNGDCRDTN